MDGYLPDFLNPEPVGYDADVDQELHQVATTPPARIRAELAASARGRPRSGLRGTDPCHERGTVLHYRARPGVDRRAGSSSGPTAGVLGHTRAALLGSLGTPRTTRELSSLHRLAAATVSYHLTRLHRAGLLSRHRRGLNVYYQRTSGAETLLRSIG